MTKKELLDILNEKIEEVNKFSSDTQFQYPHIRIIEKPKCPKCGTYEGKGYNTSNFLYAYAKCKCGYSYIED